MYKIVLIICLYVLSLSVAYCQPTSMNVDTIARIRSTYIKEELKLDSSQYKQVFQMERNRLMVADSIQRYGRGMEASDKKKMVESAKANYKSNMQEILSKKQWKIYLEGEKKRETRAQSDKAKLKTKVTNL